MTLCMNLHEGYEIMNIIKFSNSQGKHQLYIPNIVLRTKQMNSTYFYCLNHVVH